MEIVKIVRESCPAARFIGKKYTSSPDWGEWWEKGWFDILESAPRLDFNGDAYLGAVRIVDGSPERWVGMLFAPNTPVPEGFEHVDIEPTDYAVCYLRDKEGSGDFFTMETHDSCLEAMKAQGFVRKEDDWCIERYACPNWTTPDADGCVILDYAIAIK